jgi:hypothetical protein
MTPESIGQSRKCMAVTIAETIRTCDPETTHRATRERINLSERLFRLSSRNVIERSRGKKA